MLDNLDINKKGAIIFLVLGLLLIFLSGIFLGITYYTVGAIQTGFEGVDCDLPGTTYTTCQSWFEDTIYKLFALKPLLITFSYLFIFSLVIGMLLLGYKNGENPVIIGVIFVITIIFTYLGIEISNVYRELLTNSTFYDMMIPFTIYNKIMLNFPWFVAFVGIASLTLSIVNFQRARVNTPTSDLNY